MKWNRSHDEMTPKERFAALAQGKPYDRIPCHAFIGEHAARVTGIKVVEYHHSARKMAEAQIAAYRTYGTDTIGVGVGLTGISEALGSTLGYPEESTPFVADFVVKEYEDVDKLKITDPKKDGRLPVILDTLEILVQEVGDEISVAAGVIGPFSNAANSRGTERFLRDLYQNPEFAHKLLRITLESTKEFIKEASKLGVVFGIGDPTSSGSLISKKQFKEFAQPYLKELTDFIRSVGAPAPQLHICGNTKKIWHEMADTGVGSLSLDNVIDLGEAKGEVGDRVTLVGNINPTGTMYLGSTEDVFRNAKENLRKAYDTPKGYVLALGCGLPTNTKPENIHALMDAACNLGRYPLNPELFND